MAPSKLVNFHLAVSARTLFLCLYPPFLSILTFPLDTSFPSNDKMAVIVQVDTCRYYEVQREKIALCSSIYK